jgi:hypothetical protein
MAEEFNEAQKVIYDRIIALAPRVTNTLTLLQLAEAFAWTSVPSQPHGGAARTT